jgi:hypothetical protein
MVAVIDRVRSGDWLTRERIRLVALAVLAASAIGFFYLVVTAHGDIDSFGRPLGTDFSNVYAAGTYVLDGKPQSPFAPELQLTRERAIFGAATPFYGWHYPPFFLFVAAGLALMPYGLALAVWQTVTFALYLLAIRAIVASALPPLIPTKAESESIETSATMIGASPSQGRTEATSSGEAAPNAPGMWLLLAVAFPAVFVNLGHGHNGFLTAALFAAALVTLDRRPVVAGVLFGLLVYKPQFGILIPIVLAGSGRWRCFIAATVTIAVCVLATTLAFGPQVWDAFVASTRFTRVVVLEHGDTGWHKIQSVFAWVRMWGGSIPIAYAVQGAIGIAVAAAQVRLWRNAAPFALQAAALCIAAILATPYSLDYDMMLLAPAIAFIAVDGCARGFGPWEKTALAALWFVPLVARSVAQMTYVPLGVLAMLAVFVLVLRRSGILLSLPRLVLPHAMK